MASKLWGSHGFCCSFSWSRQHLQVGLGFGILTLQKGWPKSEAFVGSTHSYQERSKMLVWRLNHCCSSGTFLEDGLMSKTPSSAVQGQQQPCRGAGRVLGSGHPVLPHLSTPRVALFHSLPGVPWGGPFPVGCLVVLFHVSLC